MPKGKNITFDVTIRNVVSTITLEDTDESVDGRIPEEHAIAAIVRNDYDGTYDFEVPLPNDLYLESFKYTVTVERKQRS